MDTINSILKDFQPYIILGLTALAIILLISVIVLFKSLNNIEKKYRKFMRGVNNKNLEELIIDYLDKIDEVKGDSLKLAQSYKELDDRIKGCVQKSAIIRYRAFEDVGSDLSFSIALLNDYDDGIIISGLYGRHESTTYAKPIDKGISRYDLSEEEQHVLKEAMKK
ncbi:DUF4446 family protein [Candidatus Clostridium radicumherbarum]|uniref:DUF4446 family protein n=1 Tax=Candidatus Clostridium radicumherbarum TaxID=3381662 RepID=A0ABW8U0R9_9CLOT